MALTLKQLEIALPEHWSEQTTSDKKRWTPENPAWGQCVVTALIIQDYLGGALLHADALLPDNRKISHYWNRLLDGREIDLTRHQFPEETRIPQGRPKKKSFSSTREYVLSDRATAERYERLRKSISSEEQWSSNLWRCWELTENSECRKMRFGSVIVSDGHLVGEGWNYVPHERVRDLCDPCIREGFVSGTRAEPCAAVHAEQAALIDAHRNGGTNLSGASLYVAGRRPGGKRLIKEEPGMYCTVCTRLITAEGIDDIVVPTRDGEAHLTIADALRASFAAAGVLWDR